MPVGLCFRTSRGQTSSETLQDLPESARCSVSVCRHEEALIGLVKERLLYWQERLTHSALFSRLKTAASQR